MANYPLIMLVLIFITFLVLFLILFYYVFFTRPVKERIRRVILEDAEEVSGVKQAYYFVMQILKRLSQVALPKKEEDLSRIQERLIRAGYRAKDAQIIFFGSKVSLAILFLLILVLCRIYLGKPSFISTIFFLVSVATLGFYLPDLWVNLTIRRREQKIRESFPDTVDLLVVCVEGGLGLDAAINKVGKEIELTCPVLSDELRLVNLEVRVGKSRREALKSLAFRTGLEEISSLVVLINQAEVFGTSISRALRVHSDHMRTKRHHRAEEAAAKLPVKLVLPLMLFIFPALFVVVLGPAFIQVIKLLKGF